MEKKQHSKRVQRLLNWGTALFFLLLAALCLGAWRLGLFRSMDALQTFIREQGAWAPLAFLLLQVVQILNLLLNRKTYLPILLSRMQMEILLT